MTVLSIMSALASRATISASVSIIASNTPVITQRRYRRKTLFPLAIFVGQVPPLRSCPSDPHHTLEIHSVILRRVATAAYAPQIGAYIERALAPAGCSVLRRGR
jgi:hypothetical protein